MAKIIFYSLAALVRKILFCYSKIKFISSHHRVICPCPYVTAPHRDEEKPGNEADKGLYGKPRNLDWVTSAVILIQILLILGRCCNNPNFSDISPQNSKVT